MNLTIEQINAAQNNDIAAVEAVVRATEDRVLQIAGAAAKQVAAGGHGYTDLRDELAQVGRITVWEALPRFAGETVDRFFGFIYASVNAKILEARNNELNPGTGVDRDARSIFSQMMKLTDGDAFAAEKLAQTEPPARKRLSADRAQAARLAYQGARSMDQHERSNSNATLGDMLADMPADLVTADDLNSLDRQAKAQHVHDTLAQLGDLQRNVLNLSFGIGGAEFHGYKTGATDYQGMADTLDTTVVYVRTARSKAYDRFATLWIRDYAASEDEAETLRQAAATEKTRRSGLL